MIYKLKLEKKKKIKLKKKKWIKFGKRKIFLPEYFLISGVKMNPS